MDEYTKVCSSLGIGDMRSTLHHPLSPSFSGKFDINLATIKLCFVSDTNGHRTSCKKPEGCVS